MTQEQNILTGCSTVLHNPLQPGKIAAMACVHVMFWDTLTGLVHSQTHKEKHLHGHTSIPVGYIQLENKKADRLSGVTLLFPQLWHQTFMPLKLQRKTTGRAANHFNRH